MGGGLRKPAPVDVYAPEAALAAPVPTLSEQGKTVTDRDGLIDEFLDQQEELEAKLEEEAAQRQKLAVEHVVENVFPYAPVKVQSQRYPPSSPHAGKAYLWISVDDDEIKRRGGGASPIRYPVGVAVDAEGNVFITESGSVHASPTGDASPHTRKILADSIAELATTKSAPSVSAPPRLVHATQDALVIRWKASKDSTVDRYEVQYRQADRPNNPWMALTVSLTVRDVALEGVPCHQSYQFRVRAHNPAGWSEFSDASDIFWTLPGVPSTPHPPVAGALTNSYISLFWSPVEANGAPPVVYTLEMKETASRHVYLPIYEGVACSFVACGLQTQCAYTFRLQASNTVGSSAFVESKPIKTLAHARAQVVELATTEEKAAAFDRWVPCWDPKTEQVFYFNKYTCQRVVDEPPEIRAYREKQGAPTVEETPEMVFRRKRFRFHRDLRQHVPAAQLSATLAITLHRASLYEDTLSFLKQLPHADWFKKPKVAFVDEGGIDSGGLTKDWYLQVSQHAARVLFKPCDGGLLEIDSSRGAAAVSEFKLLGKLMAKAVFDRQTLDLPLSDVVLKPLLRIPVTMDDLAAVDAQFHKSMLWILENDITGVIDEVFAVETSTGLVALKENGQDIPVTNLNKREYVELMLQWRTAYSVQSQLDAMVQGFASLVPLAQVQVFDLGELRLLLNGKPTIDVEELRASTVFQGGYDAHAQVVLWLWQALREFTHELRGLFLKFMTGTTKVPLDGFEPPLNITKSDLDPLALPRSHTCFNQIVLPDYQSYDALVAKVTLAIRNADGFELS